MEIGNYQVGFGVTHQNLGLNYQNVDVTTTQTNLEDGKAKNVTQTQSSRDNTEMVSAKISMKMQMAVLERLRSLGTSVEYRSLNAEYEELNFNTQAIIQADDREISVNLQANVKRSFVQSQKILLNEMTLNDPLVITLDGNMPQLSDETFEFDIDSDGTSDQISKLRYNTAFLALDKNSNGKIDDGSELFGTKSGDGFADLKAYDEDGNNWIDENDKIFDKLRIWQKTGSIDKLVGLGEAGIGAIFLGNANTEFSIKDVETNELQGQMRSSGFFLFENGNAGIVSQVDLRDFSEDENENPMFTDIKNMIENSQNTTKKATGFGIYASQSKGINLFSSSDDESLIEKLKAKLQKLKSQLAKAKPDEKNMIQVQIININAQILTFSKMGMT